MDHTYDTDGERVWSWRTAGAPRIDTYALRGPDGKVLRDFKRDAGTLTWEDYIYREGQALASRKSDATVQHFDLDHLGSVRLITDAAGATVSKHNFWPYGEEYTSAALGQQMKFTGHERDLGVIASNADDLDYMHARYYRPGLGRFLSVDPAPGKPVNPRSWNRYAYVEGNPLPYVDLDGRETGFQAGVEFPAHELTWEDVGSVTLLTVAVIEIAASFALENPALNRKGAADFQAAAARIQSAESRVAAEVRAVATNRTNFVVTEAGEAIRIPKEQRGRCRLELRECSIREVLAGLE